MEEAKKELEILETQHPNKFEYLKLELRSFISFLESHYSDTLPSNSYVDTQESSSNRKRKNGSFGIKEEPKKKLQRVGQDTVGCSKRSRIDVVMERAQACLQKIQRFKTSNISPSLAFPPSQQLLPAFTSGAGVCIGKVDLRQLKRVSQSSENRTLQTLQPVLRPKITNTNEKQLS
ncbi:hypothetical protein RDI58_005488 [Solanum bulbocastanum]|uniref:Uncharacterized protein n=1 Tax=Solanum bulbocastanum TaxID=147425 RepID=A0AAN8YMR1_SOLBU